MADHLRGGPAIYAEGGRARVRRGEGYVGEKVDISARVRTMLENTDGIDYLAFVPRGESGMTLPLAQHLSILGHALVTIAIHVFPQEAAYLHVARVRVAFSRRKPQIFTWRVSAWTLSAERSTTGPECSTTM